MKKTLVAIIILVSGAGLVGSMRVESARLKNDLALALGKNCFQKEKLESARNDHESLQQHAQQLRNDLVAARASSGGEKGELDYIAALALANKTLSDDQREKLLAGLGFDWNSTGEYLVVSKQTLKGVSLDGMKGSKLTDALCGVLSVLPTERAVIEATAQKISDDYAAWMKANVRRTEPKGATICEYTITFDQAYTQSASNAFAAQISATIGAERGDLLLRYTGEWQRSLGMGMQDSKPTTFTVKQSDKSRPYYQYTIKSSYSTMNTLVSPHQPFPDAFKPLFPGGWADLAKAEGFELPKEFEKH